MDEIRIKQVIIIRKDLRMRRGKEIAQGSHASAEFLVHCLRKQCSDDPEASLTVQLSDVEKRWILRGMAKVCVRAESEEMLLSCHKKAQESGLKSQLIRDSGKTEFAGEPTYTACAIGPDRSDLIDEVTGDLKLY